MDENEMAGDAGDGEGWRRGLTVACWTGIVTAIAVMVVNMFVIPPVLIFLMLFVVGLVLLRRPGRVGPIFVGVVSILFLLGNLPFILEDISHPDTPGVFVPIVLGVLTFAIGAASMTGYLRSWAEPGVRRMLGVAGGIFVVALVVSGVSFLSVDSDDRQEGDVEVVAEDIEFDPEDIEAEAGTVSVFVDNTDLVPHTFTIDELDVDVDLAGSAAKRAEFEAEPGEYDVYCAIEGHEDMTATLTVR